MRNLNDQGYTKDNLLHLIEYEHVNQSGSNSKTENKVFEGKHKQNKNHGSSTYN